MRNHNKKNLLTPADRRRRRRSGALVFLFFLLSVLAILTAAVLGVNDGRNYKRLLRWAGLEAYLPASSPPPILRTSGQRRIAPADLSLKRLLAGRIERSAGFEKAEPLDPKQRCNRLASEDDEQPRFETGNGMWECVLFRQIGTEQQQPAGTDLEQPSFFLQARGELSDTILSLRVKLNLTDPAQEQAVIDEALAAVYAFGLPLSPESRLYLSEMLPARREFVSTLQNYAMSFERELTDERRFNLLIAPLPQSIDCGEPPAIQPGSDRARLSSVSLGCLKIRPNFSPA